MTAAPSAGARRTLVLVALLLASSVAVSAPAAAVTNVQIASVTVSDDTPAPGERFTIRVVLANLASSSGPVDVTDVYVRSADGPLQEYARIENVGTVAAGGSITVPLTVRIDDPGSYRFEVAAVVEGNAGTRRTVRYPVSIDVEEPDETGISLTGGEFVAGQERPLEVTVSNGDTAAISNVRLELTGAVDVANPERVAASLAAGTQASYTFRATFPETGARAVEARVTYRTATERTRTVVRTFTVEVVPASDDSTLTARATTMNGTSVVRADIRQFGNVELRDVEVALLSDGEPIARELVPDVPAKGGRMVTLDASELPSGTVTVLAEYTAAGERKRIARTLTYTSDVQLDVSNRITNGSSVIAVALRQFGDVELRDVEVRAVSDGETVARVPAPNVLGGSARTVVLAGESIPAGNVTVVATYTAGNERQSTRGSLQYSKYAPAPTSAISFTGLEVTRDGDTVTIDGDAANVGTTQVDAVLVSVVETDRVSQVGSRREFFIDDIGPGEFAGFEATATVSADVERIPLRVEYTVAGQRVSQIVPVDLDTGSTAASGDDGGSPLVVFVVALLVSVGGAGAAYRWRTR